MRRQRERERGERALTQSFASGQAETPCRAFYAKGRKRMWQGRAMSNE
jgi:hypothetical protein